MTGKVRRQHRLPATAIAQFSATKRASLRDSSVAVRRRGMLATKGTASRLAFTNNVYDIFDQQAQAAFGSTLEDKWHVYEGRLSATFDLLQRDIGDDRSVDVSRDIIGTLIPHLAGIAVRGEDFDSLLTSHATFHQDNTNLVRVSAWQEAQAQILNSSIMYLRPPAGREFILNDLGYGVFDSGEGDGGTNVLFPIAPDLAVSVGRGGPPAYQRSQATPEGFFLIPEVHLGDVSDINQWLANFAWREIYASSGKQLDSLAYPSGRSVGLPSARAELARHFDRQRESSDWQEEVVARGLEGVILFADVFMGREGAQPLVHSVLRA